MEQLLNAQAAELMPILESKLADPVGSMNDFEMDAEMHYRLRESDPQWSENSDNFLTHRDEMIKHKEFRYVEGNDHRLFAPGLAAINTEPHCRSLRDLWDRGYGLTRPIVPLKDCLRIASVWVEVVIRQQYLLNLDTGEWRKEPSALSPQEG